MLGGMSTLAGGTGPQSSADSSSRRESRKRRRLSERRRLFGKSAPSGSLLGPSQDGCPASFGRQERRKSSLFGGAHKQQTAEGGSDGGPMMKVLASASDQEKISMKIQFYITVAPDSEPLILDAPQLAGDASQLEAAAAASGLKQVEPRSLLSRQSSIGERIHERLQSRQNSLSQKRRQQLLAMHKQTHDAESDSLPAAERQVESMSIRSLRSSSFATAARPADGSQELGTIFAAPKPAGRSSTIASGIQDEATARFLARHQQRPASGSVASLGLNQALVSSSSNIRQRHEQREHIYFKRDGQRFGHEFTLKLSVDRSYRCLLKVRPLIPLQAISVQGHHVSFVDCSAPSLADRRAHLSSSAPSSSLALSGASDSLAAATRNSLGNGQPHSHQQHRSLIHQNHLHNHRQHEYHHSGSVNSAVATNNNNHHHSSHNHHHHHSHAHPHLSHAMTVAGGADSMERQLREQLLKQQHQQMLRHFAGSSALLGSAASQHLSGGQLVYMFDWSAGRFEVNKNKNRTQVSTVLKFKNGQILSLPLQVKFYEPECRQHLSWGNQLHFIDYDCQINSMGQMSVDRVQYY